MEHLDKRKGNETHNRPYARPDQQANRGLNDYV
jgi:hypothetical protein